MSATLRWRPVGGGEVQRLAEHLQGRVDAWMEQWLATPARAEVHIDSVPRGIVPAADNDYDAHAISPWAVAWTYSDVLNAAGRRALALDRLPSSMEAQAVRPEWLSHVVAEMKASLLEDLFPGGTASFSQDFDPKGPWRHGGSRFEIVLGDIGHCLTVLVATQHFWTPVRGPSRQHKRGPGIEGVPVKQALLDASISLRVSLGNCQLSARELFGMAPGDVLKLSCKPSDEIDVYLHQPAYTPPAFATGVLGLVEGQSAVKLTRIGKKQ